MRLWLGVPSSQVPGVYKFDLWVLEESGTPWSRPYGFILGSTPFQVFSPKGFRVLPIPDPRERDDRPRGYAPGQEVVFSLGVGTETGLPWDRVVRLTEDPSGAAIEQALSLPATVTTAVTLRLPAPPANLNLFSTVSLTRGQRTVALRPWRRVVQPDLKIVEVTTLIR